MVHFIKSEPYINENLLYFREEQINVFFYHSRKARTLLVTKENAILTQVNNKQKNYKLCNEKLFMLHI